MKFVGAFSIEEMQKDVLGANQKGGACMLGRRGLTSAIFLFQLSESFVGAGETVISKVSDPSGSFCHLKFPAIRDDTLFSDRPVLKDPSEGDIIDFYGPCNYDPLGRDSILRQRFEHRLRKRKEYGSD